MYRENGRILLKYMLNNWKCSVKSEKYFSYYINLTSEL